MRERLAAGVARRAALACAGWLLLGAAGCHHYQTHVPGVLDLRTDASEATPAKPRPPDRALAPERSDLEALALGRGVIRQGRSLLLEERHYWVGGFIPLANTSAAEELDGLLASNPTLVSVTLEEQYAGTDVLLGLAAGLIMPPLGFFMPPYTFTFHGTPVAAPARSSPIEDEPGNAMTPKPTTPKPTTPMPTTSTPPQQATPTTPQPTEAQPATPTTPQPTEAQPATPTTPQPTEAQPTTPTTPQQPTEAQPEVVAP